MTQAVTPVEIPNRAQFKAAEVCDLVKVQPYVLRTWEAEFPELGVAKSEGGPRVYRREDVEQVLKIKHLLLVEGLTLAGARRKLQEPPTASAVAEPAAATDTLADQAREQLVRVKRGLQSILELLTVRQERREFELTAPVDAAVRRDEAVATGSAPSGDRPDGVEATSGSRAAKAGPTGSARRKR